MSLSTDHKGSSKSNVSSGRKRKQHETGLDDGISELAHMSNTVECKKPHQQSKRNESRSEDFFNRSATAASAVPLAPFVSSRSICSLPSDLLAFTSSFLSDKAGVNFFTCNATLMQTGFHFKVNLHGCYSQYKCDKFPGLNKRKGRVRCWEVWLSADSEENRLGLQQLPPTLRTLSINRQKSSLSEGESKALSAAIVSQSSTLLDLFIRGCIDDRVYYEGVKQIGAAIAESNRMQRLTLGDNYFVGEGAKAIAQAISRIDTIEYLNMGYNSIGLEGTKAITEAVIQNKSIRDLNLSGTHIGDEGAKAVAQVITMSKTMTAVKVFSNSIHYEGAKALSQAIMRSETMQSLGIGGNVIGVEGTKAIADAIARSKTMRELNVWNCGIYFEGAEALAHAVIQSVTLKKLLMNQNIISDGGCIVLAQAIGKSRSMTQLNVNHCSIAEQGAKALAAALASSSTMKYLCAGGNCFGRKGRAALLKRAATRSGLVEVLL